MPITETSNFEDSSSGKLWPGYCQLVQSPEGISLNFSRVPMRKLPPRPKNCTIFPSIQEALSEATARVGIYGKHLQPSHTTVINESGEL